jgi:hypothetical protein
MHDTRVTDDQEPEFITLASACRRMGISVQAAVKLPADQLPWCWIGARRYTPRRKFERFLAVKLGEGSAAA